MLLQRFILSGAISNRIRSHGVQETWRHLISTEWGLSHYRMGAVQCTGQYQIIITIPFTSLVMSVWCHFLVYLNAFTQPALLNVLRCLSLAPPENSNTTPAYIRSHKIAKLIPKSHHPTRQTTENNNLSAELLCTAPFLIVPK